MSKFIVGASSNDIFLALHAAGVFKENPNDIRRVVIDLEVGSPARFYVEQFADSRLVDVLVTAGITLVEKDTEA